MMPTEELEKLGYQPPIYIKQSTKDIEKALNVPSLHAYVFEQYVVNKLNCTEIHESITKKIHPLKYSLRSIQRLITLQGVNRTRSQIFKDSIKKGRKDYSYMIKPEDQKVKRHGLSTSTRMEVFRRDGHKCTLCGATPKQDILEIDHKIPVSQGGNNNLNNLRVVCRTCNHGKKWLDKEI